MAPSQHMTLIARLDFLLNLFALQKFDQFLILLQSLGDLILIVIYVLEMFVVVR